MRLPRWSRPASPEAIDPPSVVAELHEYAAGLSPDAATLSRFRAAVRDRYDEDSRRWVDARLAIEPDNATVGVPLRLALGALAVLAAVFGVYGVLAGLSVFGFGQFVASAAVYLGAAFTLIGFLLLTVSTLELLFA